MILQLRRPGGDSTGEDFFSAPMASLRIRMGACLKIVKKQQAFKLGRVASWQSSVLLCIGKVEATYGSQQWTCTEPAQRHRNRLSLRLRLVKSAEPAAPKARLPAPHTDLILPYRSFVTEDDKPKEVREPRGRIYG